MKVFFDTNVYVAEALLGEGAEAILEATLRASWRIYIHTHVLDEIQHVLTDDLGFTTRLARLTCDRCRRRATSAPDAASRHAVPRDPDVSPILRAALHMSVDYLVTNDTHLLNLTPYEGLRILSMSEYYRLLQDEGLIA